MDEQKVWLFVLCLFDADACFLLAERMFTADKMKKKSLEVGDVRNGQTKKDQRKKEEKNLLVT